ncbi:hypothetical protein [Ensifer aridi]|uniref:hypothetical protein n=1 Tax=Ensifer aridi TaxID=1708715 RepID=UPI000A110CC0|nr:hypothetical protein [Ensifer aridi]
MRGSLGSLSREIAWALAILLMSTGIAIGQESVPDLPACQPAPAAPLPVGELLARAEDLHEAAKRYASYDYQSCYRVGRSCFNQVDAPMLIGDESPSYAACRDLAAPPRSDYSEWLRLKKRHIDCLVNDLNKRAAELEDQARRPTGGITQTPAAATLPDLGGPDRTLDGSTVKKLASSTTWCSALVYRVRALCADGTGVLADGRGQQVLSWHLNGNQICITPFGEALSCFDVRVSGGQLSLIDASRSIWDKVYVLRGVAEVWPQSCSQN